MKSTTKFLVSALMGLFAIMVVSQPLLAQNTISYAGWLGLYDKNGPLVDKMGEEFQKRNPGVKWIRNDVPFEQALNQATVSTLGKNAPDNIHLIAGWVASIHGIGGLEPLNDYFTKEEWSKIPQSLLDSVTFDGKIMAMPWVPGPILMFYNRNLMKQAGLDPNKPPQTWPELKEAVLAICKLPPKDGARIYGIALRTQRNPNSAQWTIPIIYGHGGDLYENGQVKINTAGTRAAYKWIQEIVQAGCSPEGFSIGESRNTMANGRAGFIFEGPWGRGLFGNLSGGKMKTTADGDIWMAPMPKDPSGKRRTIGNPHEITISSQSKNKKAAADFIRMVIYDEEFTNLYFKLNPQLPTSNREILTQGVVGADAYSQVFVKALEHTNDNPIKHAKFYAIMSEIAPALQKIISGGSIDKELSAADRKIKRLLSRSR